MSKVLRNLNKQKGTELRKEAIDCIKIYNSLKELSGGSVWSGEWQVLVKTKNQMYTKGIVTYRPSKIGEVYLKGLENIKEY